MSLLLQGPVSSFQQLHQRQPALQRCCSLYTPSLRPSATCSQPIRRVALVDEITARAASTWKPRLVPGAAAAEADATQLQTTDGREFAIAMASVLNDTNVYSKPQLMAALGKVEKLAQEKYGRNFQNVPGNSPWECLDYGDCLIHVMSAEQRDYYDVESFYATAEEVELPFVQEAAPEQQAPKWTREQEQQ